MSGSNISNGEISQAIDGKHRARLLITTHEIKKNSDTFGNVMRRDVTHEVDFLTRSGVNHQNNRSKNNNEK